MHIAFWLLEIKYIENRKIITG